MEKFWYFSSKMFWLVSKSYKLKHFSKEFHKMWLETQVFKFKLRVKHKTLYVLQQLISKRKNGWRLVAISKSLKRKYKLIQIHILTFIFCKFRRKPNTFLKFKLKLFYLIFGWLWINEYLLKMCVFFFLILH